MTENLTASAAHLPESVIIACIFCANVTLRDGEMSKQRWTNLLAEGDISPSASPQLCGWDILADLENSVADAQRNNNEGFIDDPLRRFFETLNFSILTGIISAFGCLSNVINIIVFCKQKFSDSVNISLFGLAISDLGCVVILVWMSMCFSPLFQTLSLPFNPLTVQYLTGGWPHGCFGKISSFITAYVTFERCLCVTLPLKVKTIITPRRTILTLVAIFLANFAMNAPVFFGIGLGPVSSTTVTYLPYNTSTSISIRGLTWRSQTTGQSASAEKMGGAGAMTQKDKRLVKMITLVSTIFIVCFLPTCFNLLASIYLAEYSIVGRYRNLFQVAWSFIKLFESTNSSVNIFVYYNMSSRYRKCFRELFRLPDNEDVATTKKQEQRY
ncbi:hypothetical protein RRG08_035688 [Elysia crispata]|uniref:G-protein coupled receptors family 1 profile domain-containing protein n=1 Tax=Elysia crispata TaxID=231223 RepID=A0AAE0YKB6_9GAST|nr:hypothetical protein RRG08_035688 [Elysia crispata]